MKSKNPTTSKILNSFRLIDLHKRHIKKTKETKLKLVYFNPKTRKNAFKRYASVQNAIAYAKQLKTKFTSILYAPENGFYHPVLLITN